MTAFSHALTWVVLNSATLLLVGLLPLLYVFSHAAIPSQSPLLRNVDRALGLVATALGLWVAVSLLQPPGESGVHPIAPALIHLLPIATVMLMLSLGVQMVRIPSRRFAKSKDGVRPQTAGIERVSWDDLVIDADLKKELLMVVELLKDPKLAKNYGIEAPKGILLNGPPGTGKTTIAKAIATNAQLSFFVLQLDEIVSKWVGESEKNLTKLFESARAHAPSVIFIDEVDAIGKSRSGNQVWADNLLNHLLQLVDGVVKCEGVYVIAATNRADLVDAALKRSGRLNKVIHIGLPDFQARKDLFRVYLSRMTLQQNVDLEDLANATQGKSGADIKEICNQAGLNALRRESGQKKRQFSVSKEDLSSSLNAFLTVKRAL